SIFFDHSSPHPWSSSQSPEFSRTTACFSHSTSPLLPLAGLPPPLTSPIHSTGMARFRVCSPSLYRVVRPTNLPSVSNNPPPLISGEMIAVIWIKEGGPPRSFTTAPSERD